MSGPSRGALAPPGPFIDFHATFAAHGRPRLITCADLQRSAERSQMTGCTFRARSLARCEPSLGRQETRRHPAAPRELTVSSGSAQRRSMMPLRRLIQSSEQPVRAVNASLLTIRRGRWAPIPTMRASMPGCCVFMSPECGADGYRSLYGPFLGWNGGGPEDCLGRIRVYELLLLQPAQPLRVTRGTLPEPGHVAVHEADVRREPPRHWRSGGAGRVRGWTSGSRRAGG